MPKLTNLNAGMIDAYKKSVEAGGSMATAKRKLASLKKFTDWAHKQGYVDTNPFHDQAFSVNSSPIQITSKPVKDSPKFVKYAFRFGVLGAMVVIIFLLLGKLNFPIPFIKTPASEIGDGIPRSNIATEPSTNQAVAILSPWTVFAKMKLTASTGGAVTSSQAITFKLYDKSDATTPLWTSEPKSVDPDTEGVISIQLSDVPTNLFFENKELYLSAVTSQGEIDQRIPVSTASSSSNLSGYYAGIGGADVNSIPVISNDGSLIIAAENPSIKATSGNLLVEGQAVTLITKEASDGDIEIAPDGTGIVHFLFEGTGQNYLNAQAPNLASGSLYYGIVANNNTGYDLLRLQSGSKATTKASIDALGNTYFAGNLNVDGNIATDGVTRLTEDGSLTNITGYSQTDGNFSITQGAGDTATITKDESALSSLLTLTLDERNEANSKYSTLVLNRYNGSAEAAALHVDNGNAIFDEQLLLGRYATNPTSGISEGSLIYNTADDEVYVWDGSAWTVVGSGSTLAFSSLTSGTNTSAAMVVGTGGSLTYSGSGTINASSLNSIGSGSFLRSDTSDNFTSGTLTTDAGTTLDINGDLVVSDTNIAFDGASTTFTFTGNTTLTTANLNLSGNLDVDGTSNDIAGTLNLSGNTLSSSGDLTIDPTGGGVKIGTGTPGTIDLAGDDLYVTADLEVDGIIYGNGSGLTSVDATTLDSLDSTQFLRSDTSDSFTSGTLTFDSGTTLDINGDLAIADTNIAFDGATTTFTTTGDLTIDSGGGQIIFADTDTLNVGGLTGVAYNAFANAGEAPEEAAISSDNDLYIGGDLEVDGTIYGTVSGAAGSLAWDDLTDPADNLTLAMAAYSTTFNWDPGADSAETNFILTTQGEDTIAGGDEDQVLLALSQTSNGVDVDQAADALLTFANNDLNDPVVSAIRFDAGAAGTDFTYGINFDAASFGTAEIVLSNGETIDNITDGTVLITSPTTKISGNLEIAGTTGLVFSGVGGDITFTNGEKIDNDTDGTLALTAGTTSLSGDLAINGGNITTAVTADSTLTVTGTLTANGAFDANGDVTIADTNIAFDGATTTFTTTGDLTINSGGGQVIFADTDTLNVGGLVDVAYNAFANSGEAPEEAAISSDNDLYIGGDLEVDGTIYGTFSATDLTCTDCLDFTDFEDTLDLDAALTLNQTTNTWTQTFTGDTTVGLTYNANSLTTGTALALASTATSFNGELLTLSKTGASGSTAFTSDVANITYSQTFDGGVGLDSTGNVLDISRSVTLNNVGNTLTVSGAVASISDSGTQTAGTLTSTADVLRIAQNYTGNTGSALDVTSAGGATGFALRVNDDGTFTDTTPFVVTNAGNVGVGTSSPNTGLGIGTSGGYLGVVYGTAGSTTDVEGVRIGTSTGATNETGIIKWDNVATAGSRSLLLDTWGSANPIKLGGSEVILANEGGTFTELGAGTLSPAVLVDIATDSTWNSDSTAGLAVSNRTTQAKRISFGFDGTADIGYIQTHHVGTALKNLVLNPNGGSVGIGDITPAALFTVGSGDLFQVNSSGIIAAIDGVAHTIEDVSGDLSFNSAGGQILFADTDTLNVGGLTGVAYNAFANSGEAPEEAAISSDNDLYIGGDLEVDGTIYGNIAGSAGTVAWDNITNPEDDLSLSMAAYTTAFSWDSTGNANLFSLSYDNNGGVAGTDHVLVISNAVSANTTDDLNTEALLLLDQADTTTAGTTAVDNALLITNSGGSTLTDGIQIGTGTQAITNAINIGSTGVTTDIVLQNGETIDNDTDGTITLTAPTTVLSGDLAINGGNITTAFTADSTVTVTGTLTANGTFDANGQIDLGDNGDTITIDSSDWNINATGDMSGIGSIGADGDITLTQATPTIALTDTDGDDYTINVDANAFTIVNATDARTELTFAGNGGITLGSATATSINLTTDSTGDAEVVLPNSSIGPNEVMATGQVDEYCLTYEATGATWEWQACGGAGGGAWSDLTDPAGNLTLAMAAYNTVFNWDPGPDTTETALSLTIQGEDTTGTGDQDQVLLALSQTSNGVDVDQAADALLTFANNDLNDPVVNAIRFDAGAAGTDFTYGINFDAATFGTAEIVLSNGETIANTTDGTVNIGTTTLLLTGGSAITTDQTTFSIVDATVTTLNIGGAATAWDIGASTGTGTINNSTLAITGVIDANGSGTHDIAGTLNLSGGTLTTTADLTINAGGGQVIFSDTDTINIGGKTGVAYNAFANSGESPANGAITADNDVFIGGDLEVGGSIFGPETGTLGYWSRTVGNLTPATVSDTIAATSSAATVATFTTSGTNVALLVESSANSVTVDDLILITQTGTTSTITDAIDVSDETITNAINVGSNTIIGANAAIDFAEFDVSASTGAITINDDGDLGSLTVEGSVFDINSLDFTGVGAITTGSGDLTLNPADDVVIADTKVIVIGGHAGDVAYNVISDSGGSPTSGIIASDDDLYIEGGLEVDGGLAFDLTGTLNVAITSDLAGTVNVVNIAGTPSGSAGTAYGLYIDQVDSANANGFDASLVIDNSDTNLAIADGILFVSAGGGFTDFIDTPSSVFKVDGSGNITGVNTTLTGDIAVNGGDITSSGNLTINATGYVRIGDTGTPITAADDDDDLYVQGDLETGGNIYLTGHNIYNVVGGSGTGTIVLATDPTGPGVTGDYNTLTYGAWLIQNATNNGMAALMVDQTKGGAIFSASASGTTRFTIANDGSIAQSTVATSGTAYSLTADSLTTGTGIGISADGLTSGKAFYLESTSTALTSGSLASYYWNPGSATVASGDLFLINVGANALTTGNIFAIQDNASDLFTVSQAGITSALPHAFTTPGDVSVAYDLVFTNQTASKIEAYGPLTIEAGESFENNDLTVKTYGTGALVVDAAGGSEFTRSGNAVATFNRTTSDGTIISLQQAGTEEGTISVSTTTVSYNAFTGSHYAWSPNEDLLGRLDVVSFTEDNKRLHGNPESEVLYGVARTTVENDPSVLGIYLAKLESNKPQTEDNPLLVMAVGNADVWVAESAGNVNPGDYLISSAVPGHAIKDPETYEVSNIIARAAEPIDWSTVNEYIGGVKHKRISVLFESFKVDRQLSSILALNESGQVAKFQDVYESDVNRLESLIAATNQILYSIGENIVTGAIEAQSIATNSLTAATATIDNLLVTTGLVTPTLTTNLISPLDDGVVTIDGDLAAKTIYADQIISPSLDETVTRAEVEEILRDFEGSQTLLNEANSWNVSTATSSGTLDELIATDLYVTGTAAITSLSVTESLGVGSDLVIQSGTDELGNLLGTAINTLTAPLKIQSLALAPVEIMAGRLTIATNGDVTITGNLFVAGKVDAEELTLTESSEATESGRLLALKNKDGVDVGSIDASGSANFASLSTGGLVIANIATASATPDVNGIIDTNATAGTAIIPEGVTEITIKSPQIKDSSLVYVTPTSSTLNRVLYIKEKSAGYFVVGFSSPVSTEVNFNWWSIDVTSGI